MSSRLRRARWLVPTALAAALAGCGGASGSSANAASGDTSGTPVAGAAPSALHASATHIVDAAGNTVLLKGFNLGGWFVMESYMSPMDAGGLADTYGVMSALDARFGTAVERSLMKTYQETWIQAADLDNIRGAGFNALRVPVWWGQFLALDNPSSTGLRDDAFDVLDELVANASARGLYVIIDMHGVVGGQNVQSTTGRADVNAYWTNTDYQAATAWLWGAIAAHYKGNAAVAGYDVMNEPMGAPSKAAVWAAYDALYKAIRAADPDHMLFMEGTFMSWDWDMLPAPSQYGWTNVVYEMHEYQQGKTAAQIEAGADRQASDFASHASWNVPGYIGEFNAFDGGAAAWKHSIEAFNGAGLSWTAWSYKAVNGVAPNYWGWYDPLSWPQRPDVSTDSQSEVARKWGLWSTAATFGQNTALGIAPAY
jgi:endoglucanase